MRLSRGFPVAILMVPLFQVSASESPWKLSANTVLIHQVASKVSAENETSASADIMLENQQDSGHWFVHFEASSSVKSGKISSVLPEANADAGSALDKDNKGRVQLSELYYTASLANEQTLSAGLIDISGFFEQSRIASDETSQFLGSSFTGNPTIAFPDYTLGLVYQKSLQNNVTVGAAIASSDGLADTPERSYSQILSRVDDKKGVFSIASVSWQASGWLLRTGVWLNSADFEKLADESVNDSNFGAYALAGYEYDKHALSIRLGTANPKVSQGANFASINYLYKYNNYSFGAGLGLTAVSSDELNDALKNTTHFETFVRYDFSKKLFLTGSLQRINNSNFAAAQQTKNHNANLFAARLTWLYN